MKKRVYRIAVWAALMIYFGMAVFLTFFSQRNYFRNCIRVELLKNTSSGSLIIHKSSFAICEMETDGTFTFCWNDYEVYENIAIGDTIRVEILGQFADATILNRYEIEGRKTFTARTGALIGDVLAMQPGGFTVIADFRGPSRAYVIPASCVRENDGSYEVAVAAAEKKAWGTAYKVNYVTVRIHEINEEQCSLQGLPVEGEIIYDGHGKLREGADILIN